MKTRGLRRKALSILLVIVMLGSSLPAAFAAGSLPNDGSGYNLLYGTDFEDGNTWGFAPGGGAAAVVASEGGNHYLSASGNGNGDRSIGKTLAEPTNNAEVLVSLDWKPGTVDTVANSSELLFSDKNGAPLLRLVKAGGTNGIIQYGVGSTGVEISSLPTVTGVTYNQNWLSVQVLFDFTNETVSFHVNDKDDPAKSFVSPNLDISTFNYVNQIGKLTVKGNRASGQTLNFETGLDNIAFYGSEQPAPQQGEQSIAAILTSYPSALTVPKATSKTAVISNFPAAVDVRLANNVVVNGVPIAWDSADYDGSRVGSYTFSGVLSVEDIPNVNNSNGIAASAAVTVAEGAEAPEIEGYENRYYTDFGDTVAPVPVHWGFTTANATLSQHTDDLGGNSTPKLQFTIADQSGGRVASKTFDTAVKGNHVLLAFDWYPGKVNDKGTHANENGGEFRVLDSANNVVLTINNTNNAPLAYYAGSGAAVATGMSNPQAWYLVEINFDLIENEATLKLTDKTTARSESYTVSLEGVAFNGAIAGVRLGGVRTSGNNITWTTYLDNFGVYNVPIPANTISVVDKLPYHRLYVQTATDDIATIGLPSAVTVTLADNSKAEAAISEWLPIGKQWSAAEAGVYEFTGILADTEGLVNSFNRTATIYVYNRLAPPDAARQTEWLDRGVIALKADEGIFVSWRLLADEYEQDVRFNIYRNGERLNSAPLSVTNYADLSGSDGDLYRVETLRSGASIETNEAIAGETDYLSIPMQKPEGGETATGKYTYSVNDASVGDLDGDGQYEIIVKWYPSNAIDSSQNAMTGPTIFDAYKLDGTLMWRMNMGYNLTSGAHYHQFIVADFDGDGKSEMLIKTADATTVYGTTPDGKFDSSKIISVIGNPEDDGKWVNENGHVFGGPEYMSVFNGETGEVIDTIDYAFPLGDVASWGDTWHNRSDRFLAGLAYLDGVKPSAVYGRGYYERTTYVAYSLVDGKLQELWTFDSDVVGKGRSLGYHSLATGDVDNDGFDEIIAGSLVLDQDGTILYMMDGEMGREKGSHGDAMHVGAFDPDREGLHFIGVHEDPAVASLEYHDGATGETIASFYAYVDAGRGLAANITDRPGYEFWGNAGRDAATGGGIYNVQGDVVSESFRNAGLSVNFALYWDGDLLHELLDNTSITKYNEALDKAETVKEFEGVVSNNGTKATPTLQADILGDWREEVLLPTTDSTELRIYSTTIPTEYRLYTLMHDTVYRMGIAWQNTAYNQPPHIGFYLGEDIRDQVLAGELKAPKVAYTNKPEGPVDPGTPTNPNSPGTGTPAHVVIEADGSARLSLQAAYQEAAKRLEAELSKDAFNYALSLAKADANERKNVIVKLSGDGDAYAVTLPAGAIGAGSGSHQLTIASSFGTFTLPHNMLANERLSDSDTVQLLFSRVKPENESDRLVVEISIVINGVKLAWKSSNANVGISLPYEPSEQEAERNERLAVVYIDEQGNRSPVYNGRYNESAGTVDFKTNHFSQYAVTYVEATFADLSGNGWAQKEIEALASKGIVTGVKENTFAPGAKVTRADFTLLLVRALGLQGEAKGDFLDVKPSDYYYEAVNIAKSLGIAAGQGDNRFNPKAAISRQDMMVLTKRAMEAAGLEWQSNPQQLDGYSDQGDIADYAREAIAVLAGEGLIQGSDGLLNPLGLTTRAEAAVLIYRIYNR